MSQEEAIDQLQIKISKDDMEAYTGVLYTDMADPALNGINTHSADTQIAHNLKIQFDAVNDKIADLADVVEGKLDVADFSGKADVAGDTFDGTVIFAAPDKAAVIDGAAGSDRSLYAHTSGVRRWEIQLANDDAEGPSGSNNGSNLSIARYSDSGAFIDVPFKINRKTGLVTVKALNVGTGSVGGGGGAGSLDIRIQEDEPKDNLAVGTIWLDPVDNAPGEPVSGELPKPNSDHFGAWVCDFRGDPEDLPAGPIPDGYMRVLHYWNPQNTNTITQYRISQIDVNGVDRSPELNRVLRGDIMIGQIAATTAGSSTNTERGFVVNVIKTQIIYDKKYEWGFELDSWVNVDIGDMASIGFEYVSTDTDYDVGQGYETFTWHKPVINMHDLALLPPRVAGLTVDPLTVTQPDTPAVLVVDAYNMRGQKINHLLASLQFGDSILIRNTYTYYGINSGVRLKVAGPPFQIWTGSINAYGIYVLIDPQPELFASYFDYAMNILPSVINKDVAGSGGFKGPWNAATKYQEGSIVTHAGSTWGAWNGAPAGVTPVTPTGGGSATTSFPQGQDLVANAAQIIVNTDGENISAVPVNNAAFTTEPGEPISDIYAEIRSAWWKYTPTTSGKVIFGYAYSNASFSITLYRLKTPTYTDFNSLLPIVYLASSQYQNQLALTVQAGVTYYIRMATNHFASPMNYQPILTGARRTTAVDYWTPL